MGVRTNPGTYAAHAQRAVSRDLAELGQLTCACRGRDVDTDEWYYVSLSPSGMRTTSGYRTYRRSVVETGSVLHNFAMLYRSSRSRLPLQRTLARMRVCAYGPTTTVGA